MDYQGLNPTYLSQEFLYPVDSIEGRPEAHASTIIDGGVEGDTQTLYCAWFCGTREGNIDVAIMFSKINYKIPDHIDKSTSIEYKYSKPQIIADDPQRACGNPVIHLDKKGRLHLWYAAFYARNDPQGRKKQRKIFYQISDDLGKTWTKPDIFSDRDGLWVRNPILVLQNGTWILPMNDETTYLPEYKTDWSSRFARSEDRGKSWEFSKLYSIEGGMIQPCLVQFNDGEIYCVNRTKTKFIADMRSYDNGENWTSPQNTELPNPNSCVAICKNQKNHIILIYNPLTRGRDVLSVAISKSKGEGWKRLFDLQEEKWCEFSYPCIMQTRDGIIHSTYTYKRKTISHDAFVL